MKNSDEKSAWIAARRELLAAEKSLQVARDELAAKRRALPAYRLDVDYDFLGEQGNQSLLSLFGEHSQLLAYKQRMGWSFPWLSSDKSSFNYDFEVSFTPEQLEDKVARYNYRDGASFGPEMPGMSVFSRDDQDAIYHTYSCFSRGLDTLNPVYQMLDLVPKGRDETELPYPMDWVRRNDSY